MGAYTRLDLDTVLGEELQLTWPDADHEPTDSRYTKREVIQAYTQGWDLARLAALARRIVHELDVSDALLTELASLLAEYDRGGGVGTPAKNRRCHSVLATLLV